MRTGTTDKTRTAAMAKGLPCRCRLIPKSNDCNKKYFYLMNLIDSFKKANKQTIQKTLDTLAEDSSVYSECIDFPDNMAMYHTCCAYIQGDEAVFLLNDCCHAQAEVQADERPFMGRPPMYSMEDFCWTSPVYLVQLMCHAYKEVMRKTGREAGKVHGVFLTNTKILNREDMEDVWEWLGVTVIDDTSCRATTADKGPDKEKGLLRSFLDDIDLATWILDPQYDHVMDNYTPSGPLKDDSKSTSNPSTLSPCPESMEDLFTWTPFEDGHLTDSNRNDESKGTDNRNASGNGEERGRRSLTSKETKKWDIQAWLEEQMRLEIEEERIDWREDVE